MTLLPKLSALALTLALPLLGCSAHVHTPSAREDTWPLRPDGPSPQPLPVTTAPEPVRPDERAFGARYATPQQCEAAARSLQAQSRDEAWAALRSCVERTHFTLLGALLADAWAEDVRKRPDAARIIARVVALRGGAVPGELSILHEHKVPIFALSAAIAQPDTYKGRYLLLRAQVADVRSEEDRPTVWLVEQSLTSIARDQQVGVASRRDSVKVRSGSLGGDVGTFGRANLGGQLTTQRSEVQSYTVPRYDNISDETGREALGRLTSPDPFLAPGKDYVVLARFEGLRTTSGGEDEDEDAPKLPVLTIVSYYAPHPLVVY